jgi:hypothetical protein
MKKVIFILIVFIQFSCSRNSSEANERFDNESESSTVVSKIQDERYEKSVAEVKKHSNSNSRDSRPLYDIAVGQMLKADYSSLPKYISKELLMATVWSYYENDRMLILYFDKHDRYYLISRQAGPLFFGTYSIEEDGVILNYEEDQSSNSDLWVIDEAFCPGDNSYELVLDKTNLLLEDSLYCKQTDKSFFAVQSASKKGDEKILDGEIVTIVNEKARVLNDTSFYSKPAENSRRLTWQPDPSSSEEINHLYKDMLIDVVVSKQDALWYYISFYEYEFRIYGWVKAADVEFVE